MRKHLAGVKPNSLGVELLHALRGKDQAPWKTR